MNYLSTVVVDTDMSDYLHFNFTPGENLLRIHQHCYIYNYSLYLYLDWLLTSFFVVIKIRAIGVSGYLHVGYYCLLFIFTGILLELVEEKALLS